MRSQSAPFLSLSASSHQTTLYLGRRSTPSPLLSSANFGRSSTLITPPSTHTACVELGRHAGRISAAAPSRIGAAFSSVNGLHHRDEGGKRA